jgi:3-deoxy-D-manno-octulosonate 8-phosphate phosphatase KdsC-like HAD superfamily phosphatase
MEVFFKGVFTATSSKAGIIRDILAREACQPDQAIFLRDSWSDYTSAKEAGVPFVGRQADADLSQGGAPVIKDMTLVGNY